MFLFLVIEKEISLVFEMVRSEMVEEGRSQLRAQCAILLYIELLRMSGGCIMLAGAFKLTPCCKLCT